MGRVEQEQRRFTEAEDAYNKALEIFVAFNDRYGQTRSYAHLAVVAHEQRRFTEAEDAYNKALEICVASNDRHRAASTYHQLGSLAQKQRRFAEAEEAYNKARCARCSNCRDYLPPVRRFDSSRCERG
jgi:tetratricopeptide (TPR) repeat protein